MVTTRPPTTKSSTPRLSERARVAYPSGIVKTGWPEVERQHRKLGIRFDWWQVAASKLILAKRADGLYAAGIGGVVISIPRQVGKTFMLGGLIFALCLIFPGLTALWTSHQLRTTNETFRAMQGLARRKAVKPFIASVRRANGDLGIEFTNGSRILFGAREMGFGLGFSKVDVLVFDEGQRLTEKALDDMLPTMNQAPNPLFFVVGTPPRPTDNGEVFARRRTEALSGESDDLLYIECSADRERTPRDRLDWDQVARANLSFPTRTPKAAILRMWKNLGAESFRREGYGIWDEDGAIPPTIDAKVWRERASEPPGEGRVALGVKFSLDGKRVALAAAIRPTDGPIHVEVIAVRALADGLDWLADVLVEVSRKAAVIVIDGKAGAGDLKHRLLAAKARQRVIVTLTTDQVIAAHAMTLSAITDGTVTHFNQPGLNAAVASATQRKIGNLGGWGWEPIGDGDVLPLDAVTLALYGAATKAKPRTGGWKVVTA